jgi:hypothetical protein
MEFLDEASVLTAAQTLQSSSDHRRIASPFILLKSVCLNWYVPRKEDPLLPSAFCDFIDAFCK